ncbi:hypothetical protein BS50DRAFT_465539, partial [Corynespora cassiicola Philippines]
MGVTISHTTLAPISLASTLIGFISFAFTLATFFNVFWSSLRTIHGAPSQINDYLSTLKQGLLQERRHLRRVRRRLRSSRRERSHARDRSRSTDDHHGSRHRGEPTRSRSAGDRRRRWAGGRGRMNFDRDMQSAHSAGESENLRIMRVAIRDMIREFRGIEYPFLKPEFQGQDSAHWSANTPSEKGAYLAQYGYARSEDEDEGLQRSNRLGSEYRKCGFRERWLWLRRKDSVISLSEGLSRVETRRTAHEVGVVTMMIGDIGRDLEDMRDVLDALQGRMS